MRAAGDGADYQQGLPDSGKKDWWAHQDSNLGPTDYESGALTN